jgi:multidrug efflux pump subunit AcrA (membrane-fusion protein)
VKCVDDCRTITAVSVKAGDKVKAGQVVFD